ATLVPLARRVAGPWAGLTAIILCLTTGYLYGNLFCTPIDIPFLFAMTATTLAIVIMAERRVPSWKATISAGLLTGLAIATRSSGIITPDLSGWRHGPVRLRGRHRREGFARPRPRANRRTRSRGLAAGMGRGFCAVALAAGRQSVYAIRARIRLLCQPPPLVHICALGRSRLHPAPALVLHSGTARSSTAGDFPGLAHDGTAD